MSAPTAAAAAPAADPCAHLRLEVTAWMHWNDLQIRCPQCGCTLLVPMAEAPSFSRLAWASRLGLTFGYPWQQAVAQQDATWKALAGMVAGADRTGVRRIRKIEVAL